MPFPYTFPFAFENLVPMEGAPAGGSTLAGDLTVTEPNAIELAASANIPAGGATDTTAQLTAPSGKSTSDFQAGDISDDTNPLAAIDIASGKYIEVEFCIKINDYGADADIFQLRITDDGTPIDTYTLTPTWTVGVHTVAMTATIAGASTTPADAGVKRGMAAVCVGASTVTPAASMKRGMVGAIAGTGALAGTLGVKIPLVAVSAGGSSVAGTLLLERGVAGAISGASDVAPALSVKRGVAGAIGGDSSLSATLDTVGAVSLAAVLSGGASVVADLSTGEPIRLSDSAYIVAGGGTATVARLSAPSGKTTGDFQAGNISDDTNPAPSLDLQFGKYTEVEFCIKASDNAVDGDIYQFRITDDGTPIDTYTLVPQWEIGEEKTQVAATVEGGSSLVAALTIAEPIRFADSPYVVAGGGTASTVQLTAPAGKTAVDFQGGLVSDDTNPLASIDLASDKYTELEFCIVATDLAQIGEVYDLRITADGVPINTYSKTPQYVVGTAEAILIASVAGSSGLSATLSTNQPIKLSGSSYIAAGGATATTAQMAAPAGKTTANFQAGEISDDTNALPSIDINNNQYIEVEFCITATDVAEEDAIYQFRITEDGIPLFTYSKVPEWTIVTVPGSLAARIDGGSSVEATLKGRVMFSTTIRGSSSVAPVASVFPAIRLYNSPYLAAGGSTPTTAQLTVPGGKTFQAGKISDDTNPVSAIDLASDRYTELEFCMEVTTGAAVGDVYYFRITDAGTPLDAYSQSIWITVSPADFLLTASINGDSSLVGKLEETQQLSATIDGGSSVDAQFVHVIPMEAQVEGSSVLSGELQKTKNPDGTIDGVSELEAELSITRGLGALIEGVADVVTGEMSGAWNLNAEIRGAGTLTATMWYDKHLDAVLEGTTVLTCELITRRLLEFGWVSFDGMTFYVG